MSPEYQLKTIAEAVQHFLEVKATQNTSIETLRQFRQLLGSFDPGELELVATLHFLHHRLEQIQRQAPERDGVVTEFRRIKGDKFSMREIEAFYEALKRAKLI